MSAKPVPIAIPEVGESITELQLGSWLKEPGEAVAEGEVLATLESDKVTVELVAPRAGVLVDIARFEGDTVRSGDVVAYVAEPHTPGLPPAPLETAELIRLVAATQGALWEREVDLQFMADRMEGHADGPEGRLWLSWLAAAFGRALLAVPSLRTHLVERLPAQPDQVTVLAAVRRMHHVEPFRLVVPLGEGPDALAERLAAPVGPRQKDPPRVALIVDLEPGPGLLERLTTFRVTVTLERSSVRDARDGLLAGRLRGRLRVHVPLFQPAQQAALFLALTDCIERG